MTDRTVAEFGEQEFAERLRREGVGFRIGPFNTHLEVGVPDITPALNALYADYPLVPSQSVFSVRARLRPCRARPRVYRRMVRFTVDRRRPHEDMPREQALPVLEWGLNLVIALRFHCFLMLHSAVLERNGIALLLPAAPGHGKTTLCAALSHAGWRTLSDEFGLIRPGTKEMIPLPRPMALKNESIDVIRDFAPDAFIGPATANTRKGTVAHLRPTGESIARQDETAPARLIVFPRWNPDGEFNLEPISRGEGFMLLATNAFNYELLGEDGFNTVKALISGASCYRLGYSNLRDAILTLTRLADDRAP